MSDGTTSSAGRKRPRSGRERLPWLRTFLGIVVLIVLPTVLVYVWFSHSQRATFERRNFRVLETIAARFQGQISNAETSLQNLGRASRERSYSEKRLGDFLREAARLELVPGTLHPARGNGADGSPLAACSVKLTVTQTGSPRRIEYELVSDDPRHGNACSIAGLRAIRPVAESVDLDRIPPEFDGLMLLDARLDVIAQRGEWQDVVVGSPSLVDAKGKPVSFAQLTGWRSPGEATAPKPEGDAAGAQASDAFDPARLIPSAFGARGLPKATLLDSEYLVFPVPLRLGVKRGVVAPGAELVLLGLVREQRFTQEAVALGPSLLVVVGSAITALLLALPYVKIRFMGRFERLRAADMWLLAAAAYFGTSLATITGLHLLANRQLIARTDEDLRSLALRVQSAVEDEVRRAVLQLQTTATEQALQVGQSPSEPEWYFLARDRKTLPYALFDAIFITDRDGWQLSNAVSGARAAPLWTVKERGYFRDALALPPAPRAARARGYVFDSVDSMATGAEIHVLAMPYHRLVAPAAKGEKAKPTGVVFGAAVGPLERDGVAVLGAEFESLARPILPEPFRFVVVDPRGRVLVRSEDRRNRSEDFFEEVGAARPVLGYSGGCDDAVQSLRVLGRVRRLVTCALDDLPVGPVPTRPATLVVYYDQHFVSGLAFDVFSTAAFWSALAGLACMLAAALARLIDPGSIDWLWPTVRRTRAYLAAALTLGVGSLVVVRWALRSDGPAVGYVVLLLPAAVVFVGPLMARLSARVPFLRETPADARPTAFERRMHPFGYLAFMTVGLCAIAMAPAYVAFRDATEAQDAGLRSTIDRGFEQSRQTLQACRAARYVTVDAQPKPDPKRPALPPRVAKAGAAACEHQDRLLMTAANRAKLEASRKHPDAGGIFPPTRFTSAPSAAPVARGGCLAFFGFDPSALPQRYFSLVAGSCVPALSEVALRVRRETAVVDAAPPPRAPALLGANVSAPPPPPLQAGVGWLAVVTLGVLGFFASVSKRILGLDIEGDGVVDRRSDVETAIAAPADAKPRRWLLIGAPESIVTQLRALADAEIVDLASRPAAEAVEAVARSTGRTLVVLGLETCLASAECRREMPAALSRLGVQRSVFLVASRDPMSLLAGRAESDGAGAREAKADLATWSGALRGYERARFAARSESAACEELGVSSATTRHSARLRRLVADETRWSDELFAIGRALVARPDFDGFDARRVEEYLLDAASPQYHALWDGCSEDEKLVLVQLAQEGLVNPRRADVLRRLRRRRLVRANPRFAPMSRSFQRFVLGAVAPEQVARWEKPEGVAGAALVRNLLLVLATVAAILLVLTQQSFITSTLGIASAAAGIVGSVQAVAMRFYGSRTTA